MPIVGDLLEPLEAAGGPPDGTVDLVVAHALADLVPLDRLADRALALARPGGLVHVALAYDGLTAFSPADPDPDVVETWKPSWRRSTATWTGRRSTSPSYGGSTAGRRLGPALSATGLEILADAPSIWLVRATDGEVGQCVLARLIRFVVEAVREIGGVPPDDLACWEQARQRRHRQQARSTARVGHRDVLARAPLSRRA